MLSGDLATTERRTRRFNPHARAFWTVWARHGQRRMRFHTIDVSPRGAKLRLRGPSPLVRPFNSNLSGLMGDDYTSPASSGVQTRTEWLSCFSGRSQKALRRPDIEPDRTGRRVTHAVAKPALARLR